MKERRNALTIICDAGIEVRFEKAGEDYIATARVNKRLGGLGDFVTTDDCASTDSAAKVLLRTLKEQGHIK